MGRYFANGVVTRIYIQKNEDNWHSDEKFNLKKHLNEILKKINKYIDTSNYDLNEYSDKYELIIKENFFNEHIHELIKEIDPLTDCNNYFLYNVFDKEGPYEDIDVASDNFNNKNYNIKLEMTKDRDNCDIYRIYREKEYRVSETYLLFHPISHWLFQNDRYLWNNVRVNASVIMLWMDYDKVFSEDETKILHVLNNMKLNYYKTPLSKNLIYFITE